MNGTTQSQENRTELRLDYNDLVAGRLVIVINGLPAAVQPLPNGRGRRSSSSPLVEEAAAIKSATGYAPALCTPLLLAAWRGKEALTLELIAAMIEDATADDERRATALAEYARAILYNGLGRYEHAVPAAQHACEQEDLGALGRPLLELVESAARSNDRTFASEALRRLDEREDAESTDWELGARARSAALLSDGEAAENHYRQAIERFDCSQSSVHLARARLVYGEWLRRENRRLDAREQLRPAHEVFSSAGVEAFAERSRRELMATGETARRRSDDTRGALTHQEAQIARLAQDGFSNPEIGAQLFISPRTVQYHLRKVFLKLGITSRNQLGRVSSSLLNAA